MEEREKRTYENASEVGRTTGFRTLASPATADITATTDTAFTATTGIVFAATARIAATATSAIAAATIGTNAHAQ